MKLRDALIAGVKPLAENRLRAGLSILGIFIGIAGVLCMIAIGDGGKRIIAEDIEKLGGANQFTIFTLSSSFKRRRLVRPPTERYTFEDASTIEAECPEVLYVLPNHEDFEILVTNRDGNQTRIFSIVMGVGFGVYPAMRAARLSPVEALGIEN